MSSTTTPAAAMEEAAFRELPADLLQRVAYS